MKVFGWVSWLFFVSAASTLESPRWLIAQRRDRYAAYEECLRKQVDDFRRFHYSKRYFVAVSPEDAALTLKCFDCLDPIEEEEIEDVWKPNESFIARKAQSFVDKVKEMITRRKPGKNGKSADARKSRKRKYYWEFLPFGNSTASHWSAPVDMHEPVTAAAKAMKMMRNFVGGAKQRFSIANHFELQFLRTNRSDTGWYRCVQSSKSRSKIVSRLYFVDILTDYRTEMIKFSSKAENETISSLESNYDGYNLKTYGHSTSWTKCNVCGTNVTGESMRRVSCYFRPTVNVPRNLYRRINFTAIGLFGEIPCTSRLIPQFLRQKLLRKHLTFYEFYRECQSDCLPSTNETRVVEGRREDGSPVILDTYGPGEFAANERLPPLRPHIDRKVLRRFVGDSAVLDCSARVTHWFEGAAWHRNGEPLSAAALADGNEDGRVAIDAASRLIIDRLMVTDSGRYTCSTVTDGILETFLLVVTERSEAREYVSVVQLALRFVAVLLLLCLFVRSMRNASANIKQFDAGVSMDASRLPPPPPHLAAAVSAATDDDVVAPAAAIGLTIKKVATSKEPLLRQRPPATARSKSSRKWSREMLIEKNDDDTVSVFSSKTLRSCSDSEDSSEDRRQIMNALVLRKRSANGERHKNEMVKHTRSLSALLPLKKAAAIGQRKQTRSAGDVAALRGRGVTTAQLKVTRKKGEEAGNEEAVARRFGADGAAIPLLSMEMTTTASKKT